MENDKDLELLMGELTKEEKICHSIDFIKTQMTMFEEQREKGIINLHGLDSLFVDIQILLDLLM